MARSPISVLVTVIGVCARTVSFICIKCMFYLCIEKIKYFYPSHLIIRKSWPVSDELGCFSLLKRVGRYGIFSSLFCQFVKETYVLCKSGHQICRGCMSNLVSRDVSPCFNETCACSCSSDNNYRHDFVGSSCVKCVKEQTPASECKIL